MSLEFKEPCKYTLSANEMRTFCECPRKRYYSSRDCLALRANTPRTALLLGTAFHALLQFYYTGLQEHFSEAIDKLLDLGNNDTYFTKGDLFEEFDHFIEIYESQELADILSQLEESDRVTVLNMFNCYKEQLFEDLLVYTIEGCEVTFNLENWPIDDVMYHGFIDMVVRSKENGKIYFFEHKTCAGFRPDIYSRFDIQLHIYAFYGYQTYGDEFGGIILNQVKKAKTPRGYDHKREVFEYTRSEMLDFESWLSAKTKALVSPDNLHAPCNNYMSCKMCEYQDICMSYGYEVPKNYKDIIADFKDEEGNDKFAYAPRDSKEEENE